MQLFGLQTEWLDLLLLGRELPFLHKDVFNLVVFLLTLKRGVSAVPSYL